MKQLLIVLFTIIIVYRGYEIEEYNHGYWVHLRNGINIGYKTLESAEGFVDWMEGHK